MVKVLDRESLNRMTRNSGRGGSTYVGGGGGGYTLPLAADGTRGGVQIGYTTDAANRKYAVQLSNEKMYVNVPWQNTWRPLGTGDNDACAGNDSRLSNARPASDVYSWAKAPTKPSYNLDEVSDGTTRKLSNYIPKHNMESSNGNIPTWGTLTASNGYSAGAIWSFPGGSDLAFAYKSGQVSMQVDGFFYQNEGSYRVCDVSGFDMNSGARIGASGGNLYIGNSNNAGWLMLQDVCSQNAAGDSIWSIRTNGNAIFSSIFSYGKITSRSDKRVKDIIDDVHLSVSDIAMMPAVRYTRKDLKDGREYVGSIAQNWQRVLPQVIQKDDKGILSLDYQSAALVSTIILARKVIELETKIKDIENRVAYK